METACFDISFFDIENTSITTHICSDLQQERIQNIEKQLFELCHCRNAKDEGERSTMTPEDVRFRIVESQLRESWTRLTASSAGLNPGWKAMPVALRQIGLSA
jgi:hypothetical protein